MVGFTPESLFDQHVGLAKGLAYRRARRHAGATADDAEDLAQAALLGLWLAATRYRPDGGAAFSTYAYEWVRGELRDECWRLRFWGFQANRAVRDGLIAGLPARDGMPSERDEPDAVPQVGPSSSLEDADLLDFVIRQLPTVKLRRTARLYWVEGRPTKEIAAELRVSVARVEQLHREAFRRMQDVAGRLRKMWAS